MPELPEVEVTRRRLLPVIVGRRISSVATTPHSYFFLTPPAELKRRLSGNAISGLRRHGKYLLAELADGSELLLHLGMTGQLFTRGAESPRLLRSTTSGALTPEAQGVFRPDHHTHLCLYFEDGGPELLFRDVRKFGKVRWLRAGSTEPRLKKLGPDALGVEGPELYGAGRRRTIPIKTLLLNQSVIAGVGNIYADEALFLAAIRPGRASQRVSLPRYQLLAAAIRKVLLRSIETGGSSINDYILPDGSDGAFQSEHRVYARDGLPCTECGATIQRVVLGGRSSHYCPACQR